MLFDTKALSKHRLRCGKAFREASFLWENIWQEFINRALALPFKKPAVGLIEARKCFLPFASPFLNAMAPQIIEAFDSSPDFFEKSIPSTPYLEEAEIFFKEESLDLLFLGPLLHWSNSPLTFLKRLKTALKPGGVLIGAYFGGNTLKELYFSLLKAETDLYSTASPRVSPFMSQETASILLKQAEFEGIVVDKEKLILHYTNFWHLLKDIQKMGESNALIKRSKIYKPRSFFEKAAVIYEETYGFTEKSANILPLTVEIFYLTGWKSKA